MAALRLKEREQGAEFCRFERSLIFDPANRDIGFVEFVGPARFRLYKSKFTRQIDSGKVYVLPPDLAGKVGTDDLIRVTTGRTVRKVRMDRRGPVGLREARWVDEVVVEAVEEARVPLPPPALPMDEFMHRSSANWRNADLDKLDKIIALLLVSTPPSVYGRGGLGSEGLEGIRAPSSGTPRDVAQTVLSLLPVEFRTTGMTYRYASVDSLKGYSDIARGEAPEVCFTLVRPHRVSSVLKGGALPIQLPFVLKDAELIERKLEVDLDILDYQLTALYMPPPSEKTMVEEVEKVLRSSFIDSFWDEVGIGEPDPLASVKLGLALTRLSVGKQFTRTGYTRKRTDLMDGATLFKDLLKIGFDEARRRIREEDLFRGMGQPPWADRLKEMDKQIYYDLRTRAERDGTSEFPREEVVSKWDRKLVEASLERLNRYGYILFMKGGSVIKVVVRSSPEDLG